MRRQFYIVMVLLLTLMLSGCVLVSDNYKTGYIAFEGKDIYQTGTDVYLPANAPSIIQRYKPNLIGKSGEEQVGGHEGFDVLGRRGLPILAAADGIVVSSFREPMYGNRIAIDHGFNTEGNTILTRYFHLKKRLVKKGQRVVRGQQIGLLGSSGMLAPNLHLHFEVQIKSPGARKLTPENPHLLWWDGTGHVTCFDKRKTYNDLVFRITYPAPCVGVPWK